MHCCKTPIISHTEGDKNKACCPEATGIQQNTEMHTDATATFLPSGEGGDEGGGSVDLAGGNGMCGGGLREVETR